MKNDNLKIYIAGFLGSLVTLMASLSIGGGDAIQNTVKNIGEFFLVKDTNFTLLRIFVTIFILAFGSVVCWIYSPANKTDAFIRGCSVLALLSLSPNSKKDTQNPVSENRTQINDYASIKSKINNEDLFYLTNYVQSREEFVPNARVVFNEWISSCKPSTSIWSFFLNTITICKTGEVLNKDEEIEVIRTDDYVTPSKSYRYIHIKYQRDNETKTGWIFSGRDPDSYTNIRFIN